MWRSIGQVDRAFVDRSRADRAELSRFSVDLGAIEPRGRAMFPPGRAMSARCAKIDLKSILGSILAHPPQLFCKNQVFAWRVCVSERPVTHTLRAKTLFSKKSVGRVCLNQPRIAPGGVLGLRAPTCRFSDKIIYGKNVFCRFLEHLGVPGEPKMPPKSIKNVFFFVSNLI